MDLERRRFDDVIAGHGCHQQPLAARQRKRLEYFVARIDEPQMLHAGIGVDQGIIRQAGIRRLKLHNLRDTFAVQSLLSGVPLAVVSAILGHASVVTTIKHYASIAGDELRIAAERNAGFASAVLPRVLLSSLDQNA